jgi:hypothetical protein
MRARDWTMHERSTRVLTEYPAQRPRCHPLSTISGARSTMRDEGIAPRAHCGRGQRDDRLAASTYWGARRYVWRALRLARQRVSIRVATLHRPARRQRPSRSPRPIDALAGVARACPCLSMHPHGAVPSARLAARLRATRAQRYRRAAVLLGLVTLVEAREQARGHGLGRPSGETPPWASRVLTQRVRNRACHHRDRIGPTSSSGSTRADRGGGGRGGDGGRAQAGAVPRVGRPRATSPSHRAHLAARRRRDARAGVRT